MINYIFLNTYLQKLRNVSEIEKANFNKHGHCMSINRTLLKSLVIISMIVILLIVGVLLSNYSHGYFLVRIKVYSGKNSSRFELSAFEPDKNPNNESWSLDLRKAWMIRV